MAKRNVFFSFHYDEDCWRASQVRNSQITQPNNRDLSFYDWADWEEVKRKTDDSIKRWINDQLNGSSVTVLLISSETADRKWVKYEAISSHEKGNGLVAIKIHALKNNDQKLGKEGNPHFGQVFKDKDGSMKYFYQLYKTYDYVADNGYSNLSKWIHTAAENAGK